MHRPSFLRSGAVNAAAKPLPIVQLRVAIAAFALLLAWDLSGLDIAMAQSMREGHSFLLQGQAEIVAWLHSGPRVAVGLLIAWLVAGVRWPTGPQRELGACERVYWAAATIFALLLIVGIKEVSSTSCPRDLAAFGGHAAWVSHWTWGVTDGGPGHCFPGGHASAGFALLPGWFALRRLRTPWANVWLAGAVLAGFSLGFVQQLRGAHFMSHTLWSAWLCWMVALAGDAVLRRWTPATAASACR
jgi:membrane-associated PAP2 superfamily phosphatase